MNKFIKKVITVIGCFSGLALVGYLNGLEINIGGTPEKPDVDEAHSKDKTVIEVSYDSDDPTQVKMLMLVKTCCRTESDYYITQHAMQIKELANDASSEAQLLAIKLLNYIANSLVESDYYRNQIVNMALSTES